MAADMPVKAPLVAPPAIFSWTGCYIGGNVGGIKNDSRLTTYPADPTNTFAETAANTFGYTVDGTSATAGVQYGCNRQYGNIVLGLDSSLNWSGLDDTVSITNVTAPYVPHTETTTQKMEWWSTTRARIGWAQDRWMVFAAGGLASGYVKSSFLFNSAVGTISGSENKSRYGWTAGAGLEYALSDSWFLRAEYLYVDLGKYSYISDPSIASPTHWGTDVDTRFHVARVALSYRFTRAGSMLEWAMGGFKY